MDLLIQLLIQGLGSGALYAILGLSFGVIFRLALRFFTSNPLLSFADNFNLEKMLSPTNLASLNSAFISLNKIMSCLTDNPVLGHITTFGGHPVSCAASLATMEAIQEEKLIEGVGEKEKLFRKLLVHPSIKSIRSKGLLMAIEFGSFETVKSIIQKGLENGILTDWFLHCNTSVRIAPPLIITEAQIEEVCGKLINSLPEK